MVCSLRCCEGTRTTIPWTLAPSQSGKVFLIWWKSVWPWPRHIGLKTKKHCYGAASWGGNYRVFFNELARSWWSAILKARSSSQHPMEVWSTLYLGPNDYLDPGFGHRKLNQPFGFESSSGGGAWVSPKGFWGSGCWAIWASEVVVSAGEGRPETGGNIKKWCVWFATLLKVSVFEGILYYFRSSPEHPYTVYGFEWFDWRPSVSTCFDQKWYIRWIEAVQKWSFPAGRGKILLDDSHHLTVADRIIEKNKGQLPAANSNMAKMHFFDFRILLSSIIIVFSIIWFVSIIK